MNFIWMKSVDWSVNVTKTCTFYVKLMVEMVQSQLWENEIGTTFCCVCRKM